MNNKKTRWLAALTAVILSSSTALTAFADSVPTTTQQTVADTDQQTTTGETTDAVNDSNSDDKTESSTSETKNNDSDKKTELIQVEVEDKIPTMNSSYQSSWEKAKSIDTYETNPGLFTFGDVKGADGKVIANECSVSLTANASLSSGKSVVKFPETDSKGRKVTQIGNCSGAEFYELIEGLIIPNSVKDISAYAFSGFIPKETQSSTNSKPATNTKPFKSLKSVEFYGDGEPQLETIGDYAFYGCTSLENFPSSVKYGESTTSSDETVCDSLKTIGKQAFQDCDSLRTVAFGKNSQLSTIGEKAFYSCNTLDKLVVTNGFIDKNAFDSCVALRVVDLSNCAVGYLSFQKCTALKTVKFDETDTFHDTSNGAFKGCTELTEFGPQADTSLKPDEEPKTKKIVLPDSITSLPKETFSGCTAIKEVEFSGTLLTIGDGAFKGCTTLSTIPTLNLNVGANAFESCTNLKTIKVTGGELGKSAFTKSGLTSVEMNNCSLKDTVFDSCKQLKTVKFGSAVELNGAGAFKSCEVLTTLGVTPKIGTVQLPDTITAIPKDTFNGCKGITNVVFSNAIKSYGESSFASCTGLTKITIPQGKVLKTAFKGCSNLQTVVFKEGASLSGDGAFQDCKALVNFGPSGTDFQLGNISTIPIQTFSGCSSVKSVTFPTESCTIGKEAFNNCTSLTDLKFSKDCNVGVSAFASCSALKNVTLYKASLLYKAFTNCKTLKTVQIDADSKMGGFDLDGKYYNGDEIFSGCIALDTFGPNTASKPGVVEIFDDFSNEKGLAKWVAKSEEIYAKDMKFYDAVPNKMFTNCPAIKNVEISDKIECIGGNAFENCKGITTIEMPDNLRYICGAAFAGCTGLKSFTVPQNVNYVSKQCFKGCTALTDFTYKTSLMVEISESCFEGCSALSRYTLPGTIVDIKKNAFKGCKSLPAEFSFDNGKLTTIEDYAFSGCTSFDSIYLPMGISTIGNYAFSNCTGLTNVVVETNAVIGDSAFSGCSALTNAIVYATQIGKTVFKDCKELTDIYLSDSVYAIGDGAFQNCAKLAAIDLPQKLSKLNANTFNGCKALKSVFIQDKLTSIASSNVFTGCPTDMKITYKGTEANWKKISGYAYLNSFSNKTYDATKTRLPAPVINFKATPNGSSISLTWFRNPSAEGYNVYKYNLSTSKWELIKTLTKTTSGETTIDPTNLTVNGFDSKANYGFIIRAYDHNGAGGKAQLSKPTYTGILQPVSGLKVTSSAGTNAKLTWTKNPVAQGYNVWYSYDNKTWTKAGSTTANTISIDKLTNGKKCYFKVTGYIGRSQSSPAYANVVVGSLNDMNLKATSNLNSVTLTWNKNSSAANYKVFVKNGTSWTQLAQTTNNTYTATKLKSNTSYTYMVKAYDKNKKELYYSTITIKTMGTIANLKGTASNNSVALTWNNNSAATYYKVSVKSGNTWKALGQTKNNNYTATNLKTNTSYTFRVAAFDNNNKLLSYSDITVKTLNGISNLKGTSTTNSISLTWDKNASASYYKVSVKNGTAWSPLIKTTGNGCTATKLKANTAYTYRVAAFDKNNKLLVYSDITVKTLSGISNLKGTSTTNSISLTWDKNASASYYKVSVKNGTAWSPLIKTTGNGCTVTKLSANTSYTYRVAAFDKNNKLLVYSDITVKTK